MKRRVFLILGSIFGLSSILSSKDTDVLKLSSSLQVKKTISAVQEHLFPTQSLLPSAKSMQVIEFLFETIMHKTYDKDIRLFILQGAKELERRERGVFVSLTFLEKERALRAYENSSYGSSWLSQIMVLTLEAMLSDPIYGSNIHQEAWSALGTNGGEPRPKKEYLFDEI